jgi:hypothetical protein
MNARAVRLGLIAFSLAGCQAAGPGVQVEVRAEPKQGYTPPSTEDGDYPSSIDVATPESRDPTFQLIDYRRLEGIVVWVESNGSPSGAASSPPPPLDAIVEVSRSKPARLEAFALASVGGRITLSPTGPDRGGVYILRSEAGELVELSSNDLVFPPTEPGFVEILSDDGDEPIGAFYVAPTSWAKKVRGGERVTFTPLQQGTYVVSAWHPILPGSEAMVEVTPDKMSRVTLRVGVNSLPKPAR